jgi:DNA-binding response OmpR family regulator
VGQALVIIHSDARLRRSLTDLLRLHRYEPHAAATLDEALVLLRNGIRPAALLVDEDSAGEAWAKRLGAPSAVPVILLAWNPRKPAPGAGAVLGKPFRARDLIDTISSLLAPSRGASR